jgi:hypothetical protein
MATKNLTEWEPGIAPDISGAPMPAIENAVRNACIQFCEGTLLWAHALDRINVIADQQGYTLTAPSDSVIISADDVKYKQDGQADNQFVTLDPISENQEDLHSLGSWKFKKAPTPSYYFLDKDKKLYLIDTPTVKSDAGLLVRVNLKPSRDCTSVQDFLYLDHFQAIANGAKEELFLKKGQDWYDPNLAMAFGADFREAINDAKLLKQTNYTKRPSRVRMRRFV